MITIKNKHLFYIICILFSVTALYYTLKNVPLSDLFSFLKGINYNYCILSVIILLFGFGFRALRWKIMIAETVDIKFFNVYHPLMIGFMYNFILPARVGELVRPAILKKKEKIPFSLGIATIVAERFLDVFCIVLFFSIFIVFFIDINPNINIEFGSLVLNAEILINIFRKILIILFLLCIFIFLLIIEKFRNLFIQFIMNLTLIPWLSINQKIKVKNSICLPIIGIIENFAKGFSCIKKTSSLVKCLICSIIVWVFAALSQYIIAMACPGVELTFIESFVVLIIICFFITLPSVPGYWGIWEAGGFFAMSILSKTGTNVMGFIIINHALQFFFVVIAGLVSVVFYSGLRSFMENWKEI